MAISQIDYGRDVVIVAPTGGGKSMVFQGLALKDDRNIVFDIAPINALMTDQVGN
jgi:superfamily II DNA helicase RecQ